ncbi:uncharacterized protein LOC110854059 [Folsomia candida]|nr:uncharacterized protein LOC110854059 [Folsomia candida]
MEWLQEKIQSVPFVSQDDGIEKVVPVQKPTTTKSLPAQKPTTTKYYNSKFAQFDTICGGEYDFEKVPSPKPVSNNTPKMTTNGVNSISMDNGILNIHIPCAYSFPYQPVKEKQSAQQKQNTSTRRTTRDLQNSKSKSQTSLPTSSTNSRRRTRSRPRDNNADCYDPCAPSAPPFCSTVKSIRGPPNRGYFESYSAQPDCGGPPQGRVKTSMKWDFDTGVQIPVKKVDYGEELYEQAVQIWAKQFALEKGRNGSKINVGAILSSMKDDTKKEEKCRDFSKPAFHSSLKVTNELTKALDHLNQLPDQMERIFLHDDRFEPIVLDRATKILNVPREKKVFKDLVSVEPNNAIKDRVTKSISDQIKAVKPGTRSRDAEPNLLDYQQVSFSRIRPKPVPPPPRPQAGVGIDIRSQTKYQMINADKQFEDAADKL